MTKTELTKIGLAKSVQPFRSYEDIHTQTQTLLLCSIDFIKYESSYMIIKYDLINQRNLKKFVLNLSLKDLYFFIYILSHTYMRLDIRYSCLKHQIFSDSNQEIWWVERNLWATSESWKVESNLWLGLYLWYNIKDDRLWSRFIIHTSFHMIVNWKFSPK